MARTNRVEAREKALKRLRGKLKAPARLKALREAMGLSQEELAQKLGRSGPSVNDWENGKRLPSLGSPLLLQAWSEEAVRALELPPDVALAPIEWASKADRARLNPEAA